MKGFKEFLLRGNLIELAVAVIMGTTFAAVASFAVLSASPASAHNTFVDHTDGSNSSKQCLKADPCATIGRGLDKAGRGDTVFVGGGASHLGGKDSVQDLLAKRGIKSSRIAAE